MYFPLKQSLDGPPDEASQAQAVLRCATPKVHHVRPSSSTLPRMRSFLRLIFFFFAFSLFIFLCAAQVNPALTPRKAPKPTLPKVDEKACPFEGCQFGAWTALKPVQLYTTWKPERKPLRALTKGERVTALTGVNITLEAAEIEVTAPIPDYGLKPGDRVFGYMNLGEGFFNAWFSGLWVDEFDGSGTAGAAATGAVTPGFSRKADGSGGFS